MCVFLTATITAAAVVVVRCYCFRSLCCCCCCCYCIRMMCSSSTFDVICLLCVLNISSCCFFFLTPLLITFAHFFCVAVGVFFFFSLHWQTTERSFVATFIVVIALCGSRNRVVIQTFACRNSFHAFQFTRKQTVINSVVIKVFFFFFSLFFSLYVCICFIFSLSFFSPSIFIFNFVLPSTTFNICANRFFFRVFHFF